MQEDIKEVMQAVAELDRNRNAGIACISKKDWYRLYSLDLEYLSVVTGFYRPIIPTPLMLYDFHKRMYDIPKENVFDIWYRIYKRMDHSHGMYFNEIIPYVFPLAPSFQKPETDANSTITIYRGIGTKSLPLDKAISWSTDPTNALAFATRHGEGTGLVIAEIEPEKIIWFAEGARNENEILIYPGTARDIKHEDFILPSKETLHKLMYPNLGTFFVFKKYIDQYYEPEGFLCFHGTTHIYCVLMLTLIYIKNSKQKLSSEDWRVLIYCALLHDIGRTSESTDASHGNASVDRIQKENIHIPELELSDTALFMAHLIIEYHCKNDNYGFEAINAYPALSRKNKRRAIKLYKIFKDMDGLDRVRFHGLDYRKLRTAYGKRLPLIAGALRFGQKERFHE